MWFLFKDIYKNVLNIFAFLVCFVVGEVYTFSGYFFEILIFVIVKFFKVILALCYILFYEGNNRM